MPSSRVAMPRRVRASVKPSCSTLTTTGSSACISLSHQPNPEPATPNPETCSPQPTCFNLESAAPKPHLTTLNAQPDTRNVQRQVCGADAKPASDELPEAARGGGGVGGLGGAGAQGGRGGARGAREGAAPCRQEQRASRALPQARAAGLPPLAPNPRTSIPKAQTHSPKPHALIPSRSNPPRSTARRQAQVRAQFAADQAANAQEPAPDPSPPHVLLNDTGVSGKWALHKVIDDACQALDLDANCCTALLHRARAYVQVALTCLPRNPKPETRNHKP